MLNPNSPQAIMGQFQMFMRNPMQALLRQQIPQELTRDPDKAIQYLLDSGRVNQSQYNAAQQLMKQISQPSQRG